MGRTILSRSLTQRLLTRVVITSLLVISIGAVIGFRYSYQGAMSAQIERLQYDKKQRVQREASVFRQAEQTASLLGSYLVDAYAHQLNYVDWTERFHAQHEETEPGVFRLREEFYTGTRFEAKQIRHLSSFVGRSDAPLNEERMRRISLAVEVLHRFGPAWKDFYENTHISMPENALVQYSRYQPWGRQAAADLDMTRYAVVRSTLQAHNPNREGSWTGLYYDLSSRQWVVTYQQPIDYQGKHIGTPSHDIQLEKIFARLIDSEGSAAEHAVINRKRQLIAASPALLQDHEHSGIIDLHMIEAPLYHAAWEQLESETGPVWFKLKEYSVLIVAQKIPGPEWWYVTSYPLDEVRKAAFEIPFRFLLLGVGFALILLLILYVFVSQQIARPLRELAGYAEAVGENRYDDVAKMPIRTEYHKSEVGQLIRAMKEMSSRIAQHKTQLETQVQERTQALADANEKLDKMAHVDGLTGLFNRRAFDRDLEQILRQGEGGQDDNEQKFALLLADVDYFKPYNDRYGHVAGDEALQAIATEVEALYPSQAYRFGGEELACLVSVTGPEDAYSKGESLRAAIEALQIEHQDSRLGVLTISVGVTLLRSGEFAADAIARADHYLYRAKKQSRNLVCGPVEQ